MKIQARLKGAAAPIALSVALLAQPAFAQDDSETEVTASDINNDSATVPEPKTGEAIIVTGSRIRRDEFNAPAPITVVDPALALRQGLMDTAAMIQGSPIANGSSQITSAISTNYVTNGGTGTETISLRGLGAERTLVLLNGRRAGPSGTRGGVSAFDLNVLPQSVVKRVDILKDGASSIYGSDAVAGVVNLITKTDTDGVEFDLFGSAPFSKGGETWSASATWGKTFDRGHILVSGNYYRRNELARRDRKYLQCEENYTFTDETFKTRADLVDPRTGDVYCGGDESNITWGHVWTYDYSYYYGNHASNLPGSSGAGDVFLFQYSFPGDNLGKYVPGIPAPQGPGQIGVPEGWYPVSYDPASEAVENNYHPGMNNDSVIPQSDRYTFYLDGSYEITDSVELYTELLYNKRKNYVNGSGQPYMFGYGETYPGGAGDPFAVGWTGGALFSPTGYTDQADSSVEVDYYRGVAGLRGDISSSWSWDLYGQYSRSNGKYSNQQTLQDSLDAGTFRFGSCVGDVTPIGHKDCIDIDWYSPRVMYGDYTPEEKAFLFEWETGNTKYTQWYTEGVVTGDLFDLPGGTMGVALGASFRKDTINDTPGPITLAGNGFQALAAGVTAGSTETKEAFGELNIPILKDLPLIQSLDLTAAARITNVRAIRASDGATDDRNGNWTYKLGASWEVTDWLRLRSTYGTSYRAPALFEQFLGDQKGGLSQRTIDPCIQWGNNLAQGSISQAFADNCAADGVPDNHTGSGIGANIYTGGGFGVLDPETSKAWTASMVLTPKFDFAPYTNFSLAIDYFNIEVNGEISQLGARNVLSQCYSSEFYPNDPVCSLFGRVNDVSQGDPDWNSGNPNNVAFIRDSFINVNSQKNKGIDVTGRVVHDFGGDTTLTFQAQMTWQTYDTIALFDGFSEDNNGEAGEPKWVGDFNLQLETGPWALFYGVNVVGATDTTGDWLRDNSTLCPTYVTLGTVCLKLTTPATFYHSLSVSREITDNIRITTGISNLFNTTPPRVSSIGGNGIQNFGKGVLYSQYDLLGIRGFMNINFKY